MEKSIHQFTVKNLSGKEVSLKQFEGKVLLVVNTASRCGLTPQLGKLEALYQEYKDKGLEILAFPSNDFAGQEPLNGADIGEFCQRNYGVSFPVFEKVHVKGDNRSEVFRFLSEKNENGTLTSRPKWNFHKYLLDKDGKVIDFFFPFTDPDSKKVKKAIEQLL